MFEIGCTTKSTNKGGKMKKVMVMAMCLVLLLITGTASAGNKTGPFVGGSLGYASTDVSGGQYNFDDSDVGFKIFGGYNFGIIPLLDLAVEGSYVNFGEASSSGIEVDVSGLDIFGLAALNLGPFGVFGKVGQIWWKSDSNINALDDSGLDMAYGVGVRFQMGSFGIRGEYEYFTLDYVDVGMLSAGVSWTF
jgi:hypothetical protein